MTLTKAIGVFILMHVAVFAAFGAYLAAAPLIAELTSIRKNCYVAVTSPFECL